MLLRSSSTPSLTSWFQQQNPSREQPDFIHRILKSPTISLHSPTPSTDPPKKLSRASSDGNLVNFTRSLFRNPPNSEHCFISSVYVEEFAESDDVMVSSCGLEIMVDGSGGGGGGGKICGGGGGYGEYGCGGDSTDSYYRSMIEANPNSSLILGNYAKYLKEVRGDVLKAEEYCSRAILVNPIDATALSMYADLIWETQKDASRAQIYFDQAVKASPNDSYVMAAYARFLWDADEESPCFVPEASQQFPIAAVS